MMQLPVLNQISLALIHAHYHIRANYLTSRTGRCDGDDALLLSLKWKPRVRKANQIRLAQLNERKRRDCKERSQQIKSYGELKQWKLWLSGRHIGFLEPSSHTPSAVVIGMKVCDAVFTLLFLVLTPLWEYFVTDNAGISAQKERVFPFVFVSHAFSTWADVHCVSQQCTI